jgi:beta-galactosidase
MLGNKIDINMNNNLLSASLLFLLLGFTYPCSAQKKISTRQVIVLDTDWKFKNKDIPNAEKPELKTQDWETVAVPHDWAISGAFDINNDSCSIQVKEDGDLKKKLRTGYTGGLPHVGVGWYRKVLEISERDKGKRVYVEFDGVMSHAKVYVNGMYAGEWPYGYSSFGFDVTDFIRFGQANVLAVRAENLPLSARWYPGAGIYREARLLISHPVHVKQWGTYITTPSMKEKSGTVNIKTTVLNKSGISKTITLETLILAPTGKQVAKTSSEVSIESEATIEQQMEVVDPMLWDISSPALYTVVTHIKEKDKVIDQYTSTFGFRTIEFTTDRGFFLNGKRTQLKGVALHHDLGPLGAAVNVSSLRHRLNLLQEMGANAIRTAHNPPTPELLKLADEMGFLVIDEAFDEWKEVKVENGYNQLWNDWAEKDLVAMIHRDRNHPSIILWSIGNEVREQQKEDGAKYARYLSAICHREDPTRSTTAGFNNMKPALDNGLAAAVDVVGWNYKPQHYQSLHKQYPHFKMLGSETASTVDTRGVYELPAVETSQIDKTPPYHISAFALARPYWGTIPDVEFKALDDSPFMAGEFVWTGFDYLGEPTPFYTEWPSRSSYFGIIDLSGIPKDRYYLYQSKWSDKKVLHILPHWNWQLGDSVPVHVFTNYDKAELFLNGKSLGVREKNKDKLLSLYRLIWENVSYEPGELKVVAWDEKNQSVQEQVRRTAHEPYAIVFDPDRKTVEADGKELVFVTVSVVDKDGTLCPNADNLIHFSVEGPGIIRAVDNGDQTSLESFVEPFRKAFSGKCMVIVEAGTQPGEIMVKASSEKLSSTEVSIEVLSPTLNKK